MIYFDNAATSPVLPEVVGIIDKILLEDWGNPSSLHKIGFRAQKYIDYAEEVLSKGLGVKRSELIFTSGASESNNMAIIGCAGSKRGKNILISSVEHASVSKTAEFLENEGLEVRWLAANAYGTVSAEEVKSKLDDNTIMVSLMHVNNELGTIEHIFEIGDLIKSLNPETIFHVDGTQAFGKFPIKLGNTSIDSYSASAHKIHGPKGVGLLYVKEGVNYPPLIWGGGQQKNRRSGTENVAFIAAMAKAFELMEEFRKNELNKIYDINMACRARVKDMAERLGGIRINSPELVRGDVLEGHDYAGPYILNIGIEGIKAEVLLHMLEEHDMYVSSGSACSKGELSQVAKACNMDKSYTDGLIRLSFLTENDLNQVDPFFDRLEEGIEMIRSIKGWKRKD